MKATRIALLALVLACAFAGASRAAINVAAGIHIGPSGRAAVDVGFFYDDLARYGHWLQRPRFGWVWMPRIAAASWRPYEYGHWVWTNFGWTWISDEPFGWATYHYGRWYDDPELGWEWIPGDQWGPAWVDWHADDDYVGWAPLPPSYGHESSSYDGYGAGGYGPGGYDSGGYSPGGYGPGGYSGYGSSGFSVSLAYDDYVFVPQRYFLAPRVASYAVPIRDCQRIYRQSRSFTSYRRINGGYFDQGVPVTRIQQAIGRPVTRYQVADLAPSRRFAGARIASNRVEIFRPQVKRTRVAPPTARPLARTAVISASAARVQAARRGDRRELAARQFQPQERQGQRERQFQPQGRSFREGQPPGWQQRQERQRVQQERQLQPQGRPFREGQPPGWQQRQERQRVQQERQLVPQGPPPAREARGQDWQQRRAEVRPNPGRGQQGQERARGNPQGRQRRGHGGPP